jgi:hypothetical protein
LRRICTVLADVMTPGKAGSESSRASVLRSTGLENSSSSAALRGSSGICGVSGSREADAGEGGQAGALVQHLGEARQGHAGERVGLVQRGRVDERVQRAVEPHDRAREAAAREEEVRGRVEHVVVDRPVAARAAPTPAAAGKKPQQPEAQAHRGKPPDLDSRHGASPHSTQAARP